MLSMLWALGLVTVAVIGNILMREAVRRIENPIQGLTDTEALPEHLSRRHDIDVKDLIAAYGVEGGGYVFPVDHLPVSAELLALAMRYESIAFCDYDEVFVRAYLVQPYDPNNSFLRIGSAADGSPVLMKRHSKENAVYVAWLDDGDEALPSLFAESLHGYILGCWAEELESQQWD